MRSNNTRKFSKLTKRVINRYFVSLLTLFAVLVGGYFVAWMICMQFSWSGQEPLYVLFKILERLSPFIVIVSMVVGGIVFMVRALKKLSYIDDVIAAARKISQPDAQPISLPGELSDAESELNFARMQLQESLQRRKEAEQRKNDLIMYLAHDLKTPLSSVIGYLTLLHDEEQISPQLRERYLGIALDKAQRLEDLINEFFEITRFNLSEITLEYSRIDLTRLLEQLTFEFQPMLAEKNLTCSLDAPEELTLHCDADKMQRVFDNLLRNAVLYSYPATEISITAGLQDKEVVICFRNYGDTIPKEKLLRIFEQFYRLDAARSSRGGAGLGLAIARQIVELHGGTIDAKSVEDTVEFTVTLPLS